MENTKASAESTTALQRMSSLMGSSGWATVLEQLAMDRRTWWAQNSWCRYSVGRDASPAGMPTRNDLQPHQRLVVLHVTQTGLHSTRVGASPARSKSTANSHGVNGDETECCARRILNQTNKDTRTPHKWKTQPHTTSTFSTNLVLAATLSDHLRTHHEANVESPAKEPTNGRRNHTQQAPSAQTWSLPPRFQDICALITRWMWNPQQRNQQVEDTTFVHETRPRTYANA